MEHATYSPARTRPAVHAPGAALLEKVESRLMLSTTQTLPVLSVDDFSGDGRSDVIVWANAGRGRLTTFGLSGVRRGTLVMFDGALGTGVALPARLRGPNAPLATSGDFNGDGTTDLVVTGRSGAAGRRGLTLLPGNGDGTFGAGVPVAGAPSPVTALSSGDFNGDGVADLAVGTLVRGNTAADGAATGTRPDIFEPRLEISQLFATRLDFADFFGNGPGVSGLATGVTPPGGAGVDTAFLPQRGDFDVEPRLAVARFSGQTGATEAAGSATGFPFGDDRLVDGGLDINPLVDTVVVLLNNGDGTFQPSTGGDA